MRLTQHESDHHPVHANNGKRGQAQTWLASRGDQPLVCLELRVFQGRDNRGSSGQTGTSWSLNREDQLFMVGTVLTKKCSGEAIQTDKVYYTSYASLLEIELPQLVFYFDVVVAQA